MLEQLKRRGQHTSPTSALVTSGLNLWAALPTVTIWVAAAALGVDVADIADDDADADDDTDGVAEENEGTEEEAAG